MKEICKNCEHLQYDFTCGNGQSEFFELLMEWQGSCDEFEPKM